MVAAARLRHPFTPPPRGRPWRAGRPDGSGWPVAQSSPKWVLLGGVWGLDPEPKGFSAGLAQW